MRGKHEKIKNESLQTAETKKKYRATLLRLLLLVVVVIVLVLNLFTHVFRVVHYYGESMEPALHDRQILVVHKTDKVGNGDIVAFYYCFSKLCAALSGAKQTAARYAGGINA